VEGDRVPRLGERERHERRKREGGESD
jgi:hypothetical protein